MDHCIVELPKIAAKDALLLTVEVRDEVDLARKRRNHACGSVSWFLICGSYKIDAMNVWPRGNPRRVTHRESERIILYRSATATDLSQ